MKVFVPVSLTAASKKAFTSTFSSTTRSVIGGVTTTNIRSPTSVVLFSSVVKRTTTTSGQTRGFGTIAKDEVRALFGAWNDALATGDSRVVASRYAEGATLLPTVRCTITIVVVVVIVGLMNTCIFALNILCLFSLDGTTQVSDIPRTDFDSIKNYFDTFLQKKPQGEIVEGYIRTGDGWAQDNGLYEFTMGATGDVVRARYSFMYVQDEKDGKWKIGHHHSSQMPEEVVAKQPIEEQEVRNLFYLVRCNLPSYETICI
jgi:hypothetical protein